MNKFNNEKVYGKECYLTESEIIQNSNLEGNVIPSPEAYALGDAPVPGTANCAWVPGMAKLSGKASVGGDAPVFLGIDLAQANDNAASGNKKFIIKEKEQ